MHPTNDQLDAYIARTLARAERRELDRHLTTCLRCVLQLESAAAEPQRWERRGLLQRLVPVAPTLAERRSVEVHDRAAA